MRLLRQQESTPFFTAEEGRKRRFFQNFPCRLHRIVLQFSCLRIWGTNPPGKTPPEESSPYASAAAVPSASSAFNVELSVLQEIFPVYLFILLNRTMPKCARAQRTTLLYLSSISDGA